MKGEKKKRLFVLLVVGFLPFFGYGQGREEVSVLRVQVPAHVDWTDTGLDVTEGQEISFNALGEITLQKGNPMAHCGPEGYNLKSVQQPLPDRNIGALIGKIYVLISMTVDKETGEEIRNEIFKYFFVGAENKVSMPMAGRLFLGINENVVADNEGEYTVIVSIEEREGSIMKARFQSQSSSSVRGIFPETGCHNLRSGTLNWQEY